MVRTQPEEIGEPRALESGLTQQAGFDFLERGPWAADMTIEQVGSVGEIIGAAATVATLAYLAVQIRQNNRLVAASIADSSRDSMNELARILGANPEATRVYAAGVQDPSSLSLQEMVQFDSLCHLALNALHQRFESGLDLDEGNFVNLSNPGFRTYWGRQAETYPEDFRRLVSEAIAER